MGEADSAERVGHGWPTPVLQAEQDARAQQGKCSAQGRVHSASSMVRHFGAYRRISPGKHPPDWPVAKKWTSLQEFKQLFE